MSSSGVSNRHDMKSPADENLPKFVELPPEHPIFQFSADQVPAKLLEAEDLHMKGDFDTALGIYCNALKLYVEKYGELSLEAATIYKEYGSCLFEKARTYNTTFGEAGVSPDEEGQSEQPMQDDDTIDEESVEGGASADEDDDEDAQETDYLAGNNDAELVESNLELAMENLDVARYIFEEHIKKSTQKKQTNIYTETTEENKGTASTSEQGLSADDLLGPDSTLAVSASDIHLMNMETSKIPLERFQLLLGDVYETMGEVAMEEESWDRALSDLSRSLEIRERVEKCDGRALASVHNKLAMYYSLQNAPKKACHHYTLAASVFVNRMATKMKEVGELSALIQQKMEDPQFGLSKGSRKYLLEIMPPVADKIDKEIEEIQVKMQKCLNNIADFREIRRAIMEKVQDCEEEIKSGLVEDDDGGEKVRTMIKEVMRTNAVEGSIANGATGASGVTTTGFGVETTGFSTTSSSSSSSSAEPVPVTVLTVKRKKPAAASSSDAGLDTNTNKVIVETSSAVVEDEPQAKKTKMA